MFDVSNTDVFHALPNSKQKNLFCFVILCMRQSIYSSLSLSLSLQTKAKVFFRLSFIVRFTCLSTATTILLPHTVLNDILLMFTFTVLHLITMRRPNNSWSKPVFEIKRINGMKNREREIVSCNSLVAPVHFYFRSLRRLRINHRRFTLYDRQEYISW